ncbi:LLM class flavin-dependent oxidoreductase [Gammaproteobacteria bacterium]|nr:LLM class flavin-dependent oxidoreductase [Gammaproteobacteria bacterium]
MKFGLFMYCTIGRRGELEQGMAGQNPELYQRMLSEIAQYAEFADKAGYFGFGHPEHHLQIEGFEISNDPCLMAMWLGSHTERMKVITCGFVSTANNPLQTAEKISTLDHMLQGRFGVGLVRGYQARWVENYKVLPQLNAVGPWNAKTEADEVNRQYFAEFVDIVVTALTNETINYQGEFWSFPPKNFVNPHEHPVYSNYGQGVSPDMSISEVGIAPKPYQSEIPLYGGFSQSLTTAKFWAKYKGKPIVLSGNTDFLEVLWREWSDEAERHGHQVMPGQQACWGGIMICAETDAKAQKLYEEMSWFWKTWSTPFGQGLPELLVGSPDTLNKEIERVSKTVPIDEAMLLIPQGLLEPSQLLDSLDLFSRKVMTNHG